MNTEEHIFSIERPHRNLMKLYLLRCLVVPPFSLVVLPFLYFRYHTLRYRFDEEGISMRWGILFRREVNLTYARIQDIHLASGILQRWLGLADIHIQTASGTAAAEMTIEGLLEYEAVRDFLYGRMRGLRESRRPTASPGPAAATVPSATRAAEGELVGALQEVCQALRATREALEKVSGQGGESHV